MVAPPDWWSCLLFPGRGAGRCGPRAPLTEPAMMVKEDHPRGVRARLDAGMCVCLSPLQYQELRVITMIRLTERADGRM